MTYQFVGAIMKRVENEYLNIICQCEGNQVNTFFQISQASIYLEQKVEDYQINQLRVKSIRKNNFIQVSNHLEKNLNRDIVSRILEYLTPYDFIELQVDIHYDPFLYPFKTSPEWRLIKVDGMFRDIMEYLVQEHDKMLKEGWSPAICLRSDLAYFMSKYCKILE